MTEPGMGSDLASMTTTAVRDGDVYIVNGSKDLHHQRDPRRSRHHRREDTRIYGGTTEIMKEIIGRSILN